MTLIWRYGRYINIWDKVFKNEPSKICGRKPFKNLKSYGLFRHTISNCLKAVFHKFYLVHSWILCPISSSTYDVCSKGIASTPTKSFATIIILCCKSPHLRTFTGVLDMSLWVLSTTKSNNIPSFCLHFKNMFIFKKSHGLSRV